MKAIFHSDQNAAFGCGSKRPATRRQFGSAFTLVELLVVIAIICVLASLLLPAISRTRDRGRNTVCVSQLRQLGAATRLYAEDNNNRLPAVELLPTSPVNPTNPLPRICDVLGPDVGKSSGGTNSPAVFDCPADTEGRFAAEGSSYEWNIELNGHRMDESTSENLTWFLVQEGVPVTNGTVHLTFEPSSTPLLTDYDDFHPRSGASGKNVVFMDGHVTALQLSDIQ